MGLGTALGAQGETLTFDAEDEAVDLGDISPDADINPLTLSPGSDAAQDGGSPSAGGPSRRRQQTDTRLLFKVLDEDLLSDDNVIGLGVVKPDQVLQNHTIGETVTMWVHLHEPKSSNVDNESGN